MLHMPIQILNQEQAATSCQHKSDINTNPISYPEDTPLCLDRVLARLWNVINDFSLSNKGKLYSENAIMLKRCFKTDIHKLTKLNNPSMFSDS